MDAFVGRVKGLIESKSAMLQNISARASELVSPKADWPFSIILFQGLQGLTQRVFLGIESVAGDFPLGA